MAQYSGPGVIYYRGIPMLQSDSISFRFDSDNKDVNTLILGRSGHSAGAANVKVEVSQAIPLTGTERPWVQISAAQEEVPLSFKMANGTYNMTGDVRDVTITSSVEAPNKVSFSYSARLDQVVS